MLLWLNGSVLYVFSQQVTTGDYWTDLTRALAPEKLDEVAAKYRKQYYNAAPFPHFYVDNLFPNNVLEAILEELKTTNMSKSFGETGIQYKKSALEDERAMKPVTRMLFGFLKSSIMMKFLQDLTGVDSLIADPGFRGSGIHMTGRGGHLKIHADFNKYDKNNNDFQLYRRVNTFIYLNKNWDEKWGGHLELWNREMDGCYARYPPAFNRYVVFSSTDFSYHGHPDPLDCPDDQYRISIALYYYTSHRPKNECLKMKCNKPHSTLWQDRKCKGCTDDAKCQCQLDVCKRYEYGQN